MISFRPSLRRYLVMVLIVLTWTSSNMPVTSSPTEMMLGDRTVTEASMKGEDVYPNKIKDLPRFDPELFKLKVTDVPNGKKVLVMMDVSGTIRERANEPERTIEWRQKVLSEMERNEKYLPFLNSGGTDEDMTKQFEGHKEMGMYAEHGTILRKPGGHHLVTLFKNDNDWRKPVVDVLKGINARDINVVAKPGCRVIYVTSRGAKTENGVREFYKNFKNAIVSKNFPINHTITNCGSCIEITHSEFDKGTAVRHLLEDRNDIGLILAAGDTERDADMHREVRLMMKERNLGFFNVIIKKGGCQTTEATHQLNNYHEFLAALGDVLEFEESYPYPA